MRFEIDHAIEYRYNQPVFFEPLVARLRPRLDLWQSLLEFQMVVEPEPLGKTESNDLDGNCTVVLWFEGTCDHLTIRTRSVVETHLKNPFDFIITDSRSTSVPVVYPGPSRKVLEPFLEPGEDTEGISELVQETLSEAGSGTVPFLTRLTSKIHERVQTTHREVGPPHTPNETLTLGSGACRDLTVVLMEACRQVGIASRFVSGYREVGPDFPEAHLHAWAEVYLPGAGWRGFDPTSGLAVGEGHVALASAAFPEQAAPTAGTYRGNGVSSHLDYQVQIVTSQNSESN